MVVKTAVSIPDDVFKSAERLARRLGVSRSELYARAVAEWIARQDAAAVTARLDEVYTRQENRLDPALRAQQRRALPKEDW
jgi:predicted transcriptional regulator